MTGIARRAGPMPPAAFPAWLPAAVMVFTLFVFAAALLTVNLRLRGRLRQQIAGRDAQVLSQLAFLQEAHRGLPELSGAGGQEADADVGTVDALLMADELSDTVSKFRGISAVRLFTPQGKLVLSLPPDLKESDLAKEALSELHNGKPYSRFWPYLPFANSSSSQKLSRSQASSPLLEVVLPLIGERQSTVGVVQLYLSGEGIAREYAALDRRLLTDGLLLFVLAGLAITFSLALVFRRLLRTHTLLEQRTSSLLRANTELALAAKTSAVGAVVAHLLHGLKSPLSGLQQFVSSRPGTEEDQVWQAAVDSTRRMQRMVQEVVRVLSEDQRGEHYELTYEELVRILHAKAKPLAAETGVSLVIEGSAEGSLNNRDANLMTLILENLLSNAVQATPRGGTVRLSLRTADRGGIEFQVSDQGPGFPAVLKDRLFSPVASSKTGGSGIGLAISKQLASHLGATLELAQDGPTGCLFVLRTGKRS